MANVTFNIAKGRAVYYGTLSQANDGIGIIPLETAGLEADATLIDYDNVSLLLAGTTNEQTTMGRKVATSVTVIVDDTTDTANIDCADPVWTGATGNAISGLLFTYIPDTTVTDDTVRIPLSKSDFVVTPSGADITGQVDPLGFYGAS